MAQLPSGFASSLKLPARNSKRSGRKTLLAFFQCFEGVICHFPSYEKTLFLYENGHESAFFFELEGNYSRLNDVYINGCPFEGQDENEYEKLCDGLNNLVSLPDEPYWKVTKLDTPTKDWTYFVKCGFLD